MSTDHRSKFVAIFTGNGEVSICVKKFSSGTKNPNKQLTNKRSLIVDIQNISKADFTGHDVIGHMHMQSY